MSPHTTQLRSDDLFLSPAPVKFLEDRDAPTDSPTFQRYWAPVGPSQQDLFTSCNGDGKLHLPLTWKTPAPPFRPRSSLLLLFPKSTPWKYLLLLPTSLSALGVLVIFLFIASGILFYLSAYLQSLKLCLTRERCSANTQRTDKPSSQKVQKQGAREPRPLTGGGLQRESAGVHDPLCLLLGRPHHDVHRFFHPLGLGLAL